MEIKRLKQLIKLMKKNDIGELEIEEPDLRIKLKAGQPASSTMPIIAQPVSALSLPTPVPEEREATRVPEVDERNVKTVKSPMVGTFYRSPSPDKPHYVEEEDIVGQGQILCVIEAMKLMNEIESPVDGKLISVMVQNAQPVEYDEPLFLIEMT